MGKCWKRLALVPLTDGNTVCDGPVVLVREEGGAGDGGQVNKPAEAKRKWPYTDSDQGSLIVTTVYYIWQQCSRVSRHEGWIQWNTTEKEKAQDDSHLRSVSATRVAEWVLNPVQREWPGRS